MATDLARAQLLTGGEAIVEAMCQVDPDVVPVYPITPQTPIIQGYAKALADGRAHGEMINVESEHSAMSAAIAAAVAGARTMTATSSQGLALMAEVVYIAASMRAPVVMALGNRALSGPINIHCDHSDSMLIRDSGAIQLFAESAQEAYDLTVLAPRLAEHPDVLLPVIVCVDGFTITHSAEPVELLDDDQVRDFVGEYRIPPPAPRPRQPDHPGTVRDARLLLRAAPPAGGSDRGRAADLRAARRRAVAPHRPRLRRRRGLPARRRRARARLPRLDRRHGEGRGRRAARRGRGGRPAPDLLVSAVPGRRGRRLPWRTWTRSWCSTAQTLRAGHRRSPSRSPMRPAPSAATSTASAAATSTLPTSVRSSPGPRRSTSA